MSYCLGGVHRNVVTLEDGQELYFTHCLVAVGSLGPIPARSNQVSIALAVEYASFQCWVFFAGSRLCFWRIRYLFLFYPNFMLFFCVMYYNIIFFRVVICCLTKEVENLRSQTLERFLSSKINVYILHAQDQNSDLFFKTLDPDFFLNKHWFILA